MVNGLAAQKGTRGSSGAFFVALADGHHPSAAQSATVVEFGW
jgi:hypothetical protein